MSNYVTVALSAEDIANSMGGDELVEFIKGLDEARGEWDVTLALHAHFEKLKGEHEKEEAEDRAKAELRALEKSKVGSE